MGRMSVSRLRSASLFVATTTLTALLVLPGVAHAKDVAPAGGIPPVSRPKAPLLRPSQPLARSEVGVARLGATPAGGATTLAATATATAPDSTPPIGPAQVTAQAQSISTISAQW